MSVTQSKSEAMFINGEWTEGSSSNRIPVYDPSSEEVIAEIPDASVADVDAAVAAARHAFDQGGWPQTTAQERGRILFRIAEKIRAEAPRLPNSNRATPANPSLRQSSISPTRLLALSITVGWPRRFPAWSTLCRTMR